MAIKTNISDKTEIKKNLKISGHQQSWSRPLPGAILIPPALLVVADCGLRNKKMFTANDFFGRWAATIYCGTPNERKTGDMVYIPKKIGASAWRWV